MNTETQIVTMKRSAYEYSWTFNPWTGEDERVLVCSYNGEEYDRYQGECACAAWARVQAGERI